MDTFFARNRLSAYLDGELSSVEAKEVEAALARDAALRTEFDTLRNAVDALRADGIVDPPPGFADRLAVRLEREPMPTGWRRWTRQVRLETALLAAAALLVVAYVGHRDELPDMEAPAEGIATADAFGSAEIPAEAEALEPPVESAPIEAAASAPATAPPATSVINDGVLGNEVKSKPLLKEQSLAQRMPKMKSSSAKEVEPWQADWEKEPDSYGQGGVNTASGASSSAGNAEPAVEAGQAASPQGISFYSPAPFRYRVAASSERALKQLAAIAKDLGGELQDSRGRPVAAWVLEEGESRTVRVAVPAYNQAALAQRLREIGAVTAIKQEETLVTDPNASLPIQVDVAF